MKGLDIYTIEAGSGAQANDHVERKLETLESKDGGDKNENLREAQEALVGNEKLYEDFLKAMLIKDSGNGVSILSRIENIFISQLQQLTDSEIESIIRQFNMGFKKFVSEYRGKLDISYEQRRKIFEDDQKFTKGIRGNIQPNGILNIIHFIRARKQLLGIEPAQEYCLYTNDVLDAKYKIDLIECLFERGEDGELSVAVMNLIQMKSSDPGEEERKRIVSDHREWITSSVMDLDSFEKEFSDGIPDNLPIEALARNKEEVEMLLMELCTDPDAPEGQTLEDRFMEKLNLDELSNKQKAWLLAKYAGVIKKSILEAVGNETVDQESADKVLARLETLEQRVRSKAKLPRNLSFVESVHSIIAVGPKIISDVELVAPGQKKANKKVLKYQ